MTIAQLPDGTQLNFPDGTDPGVIQATVKKVLAQTPQTSPHPAQDALDAAVTTRNANVDMPISHLFDGTFIQHMQDNVKADANISKLRDAAGVESAASSKQTAQPSQGSLDWQKVQDKPLLDRLPFYGKLAASSLLRGLLALPAAAADAGTALNEGRGNAQVGDAANLVGGVGTQPQTGPQRYASAGLSGATAGLTSPGAAVGPIRAAISGGTSGLASQAAGQATSDQSQPIQALAQTMAGVLGGGMSHLAMAPKTTGNALVQTALRDTNIDDLAAARARMADVQNSGLGTINASQAMTQPSGLDKLVDVLANSKSGKGVQAQLRGQPSQVAVAAEDAVNQLPGEQLTPQDSANNLQSAATDVIENTKKARSAQWNTIVKGGTDPVIQDAHANLTNTSEAAAKAEADFSQQFPYSNRQRAFMHDDEKAAFDKLNAAKANLQVAQEGAATAAQVPPQAVAAEVTRLQKLGAANPNTETGAESSKLARQLIGSDGKPLTDPTLINNALVSYTTGLANPTLGMPGATSGTIKYMGGQVQAVRDNLGNSFEPIRAANQAFQANTENVINPLKQSVTGRMSGIAGYDPAKEAPVAKVQALFDKGTVPGGPSDILTLQKSLQSTPEGPQVFQDAFKTWVRGKISSAMTSSDNRTPDNVASSLTKVFGDPDQTTTQSQGTKDMLVGLARSQGLSDSDQTALVNGFQKMQRFAAAASRRPGSIGDSTGDLNKAAAGGSQEGLRDNVSSAFFGLRRAISELRGASAFRFADNLVTTPEGMDTLIRMAKEPAMSQGTASAISTLAGINAANQNPGH